MRPECRPPSPVRKAGRPGEGGVHQALDAPLADGADLRHRDGQHVGGHGHRLAVEVAAGEQLARSPRRPSGCRWPRSSRRRPRASRSRARRAPRRAPAGCSAGCRRPAPCRSRGATRGARCPRAAGAGCRADACCPGCGRAAWMRGSKATSVPLSASRVSAPTTSAVRASRHASASASPATAVMSCVPLMRARPSFASQGHRGEAGARSASATGPRRPSWHAVAFADQRQREVGEGRQVAAGPHGALRRDDGVDARVQHRDQEVEGLGPDAAEALGQHVRAQHHEGARLRLVQRLADAGGVAAHQVELELAQLVARDDDVGEVAEAGVDAVDDLAARDRVVDHAARARDRLARARRETPTGAVAARHRLEVVEGEARAVEQERGQGARVARRVITSASPLVPGPVSLRAPPARIAAFHRRTRTCPTS